MKRLYRSRSDRIIAGVCGGIARYLNADPVVVRLIAVLLAFASGFGIIAYIVAWIIVPLEPMGSRQETRERGHGSLVMFGIILVVLGLLLLIGDSFWWLRKEYILAAALVVLGIYLINNRQ